MEPVKQKLFWPPECTREALDAEFQDDGIDDETQLIVASDQLRESASATADGRGGALGAARLLEGELHLHALIEVEGAAAVAGHPPTVTIRTTRTIATMRQAARDGLRKGFSYVAGTMRATATPAIPPIVKPPGHGLLALARIFLPQKQLKSFEERVADLREEVYAALATGETLRGRVLPWAYALVLLLDCVRKIGKAALGLIVDIFRGA